MSLQNLYEQQYQGEEMLWYSTRDKLFAPFDIKTANYTKDWQLQAYAFAARYIPVIRKMMVRERTRRRKAQQVPLAQIAKRSKVIIGHFAAAEVMDVLPPDRHEYRTVVREPLARMISHYNYWRVHKGDVGHRVVPAYDPNMSFEEFALLPELRNYQLQAIGDPVIFQHIGTTDKLGEFALATGLVADARQVPSVNHFSGEVGKLSADFMNAFEEAHAKDIELYHRMSKMSK